MRGRELKFNMMNEAKCVRKGKRLDVDLWRSFEDRLIVLMKNLHIRSILRCLQPIASIQLYPSQKFHLIISEIAERRNQMKPRHYVFLFQALSRLKWKDLFLLTALKELTLCWPLLKNKFLIKASNSLAKLDATSHILCTPLRNALRTRIKTFTGRNCFALKAITLQEFFDESMLIEYLDKCLSCARNFTSYSRHLQILELYLRLVRPRIYENISDEIKFFLQSFRESSESMNEMSELDDDDDGSSSEESDCTDDDGDSLEHSDCIDDELKKDKDEITDQNYRNYEIKFEDQHKNVDVNRYNCALHGEISKILNIISIPHQNRVLAGPYMIDIFHPETKIIIESNPQFQYYVNTTCLTTTTRRRHELLISMGFKLYHVPYFEWRKLTSDEDKILYLKKKLPSYLFNSQSSQT